MSHASALSQGPKAHTDTNPDGRAMSPSTPASASSLDDLHPNDFKTAFRHHPGGVAVITATGPNGHVALTATSVSSVSAEPPLLVFSVSALSSATPTIVGAEHVVVHLIDTDSIGIARLAATSGIDRFADTSLWHELPTGEPVFHGTRWLRTRIESRVVGETATIIVARALESNVSAEDPQAPETGLVYVNREWHGIGDHTRFEA